QLKIYQTLSWINLAVLLGMVTSLPFAPPWDGETRIFAATLPLFFLLPAFGIGGLYQLIVSSWHRVSPGSKVEFHPNIAIGTSIILGGTLTIVIATTASFVGTGSKDRQHPVKSMIDELTLKAPSVNSVDLRSLRAGYHLRVADDTQPTWLPNI